MKTFFLMVGLVILFPMMGNALTVDWNRNTEPDMKQYHVYVCRTAGCIATNVGSTWIGTVVQPAVGIRPFQLLPDQVIGAVSVVAEDIAGNVSGPSVSLPFSTVPVIINAPPLSPTGLTLKP